MPSYRDRIYLAGPMIAGTLYFVLGFLMLKIGSRINVLYDSFATPWGFLTSVLIYDGAGNVQFYVFLLSLFYLENLAIPSALFVKRSLYSVWIVFSSAIFANLIWFVLFGIKYHAAAIYGQSGAVYGLWGIVLFFALYDLMFIGQVKFSKHPSAIARYFVSNQSKRKWKRVVAISFGSLVILFTLSLIFLDPRLFLSYAPNINIFVHAYSFLIALITGIGFRSTKRGSIYLFTR